MHDLWVEIIIVITLAQTKLSDKFYEIERKFNRKVSCGKFENYNHQAARTLPRAAPIIKISIKEFYHLLEQVQKKVTQFFAVVEVRCNVDQ